MCSEYLHSGAGHYLFKWLYKKNIAFCIDLGGQEYGKSGQYINHEI